MVITRKFLSNLRNEDLVNPQWLAENKGRDVLRALSRLYRITEEEVVQLIISNYVEGVTRLKMRRAPRIIPVELNANKVINIRKHPDLLGQLTAKYGAWITRLIPVHQLPLKSVLGMYNNLGVSQRLQVTSQYTHDNLGSFTSAVNKDITTLCEEAISR
jgi:hypothetical protein